MIHSSWNDRISFVSCHSMSSQTDRMAKRQKKTEKLHNIIVTINEIDMKMSARSALHSHKIIKAHTIKMKGEKIERFRWNCNGFFLFFRRHATASQLNRCCMGKVVLCSKASLIFDDLFLKAKLKTRSNGVSGMCLNHPNKSMPFFVYACASHKTIASTFTCIHICP